MSTSGQSLYENIIGGISYFKPLPLTEIQTLARQVRHWRGGDGEVLFTEGEPAAGLYYLIRGRVHVVRHSPEGRQLIVRQFHPGDTFNEVGALDGTTNAATAVAAAADTEVLLIPGHLVRDLAARYPTLGTEMMQEMARKLRFAMTRINRLGLMDVKARLCAWLLDYVDESGFIADISQEELAAQLGTVRQVIGRALGELRREGVVEVGRGFIRIIDKDALKDIVG